MAERVVLSNGELRTETGAPIRADALTGPQAAAIEDLVASEEATNPTTAEHNLAVAAINSILAVLRDNGSIAAE